MKHYFKLFLDKFLCKHKWEEMYRSRTFETEGAKHPYKVYVTLNCTECGEIKQMNIL